MGSRMGKGNRTTLSRKIKQDKVYEYLVGLAKEGKDFPNLTNLYRTRFHDDMHLTNLMEVLQQLNLQGKIIYRKGKILAVSIPKANETRERAFKFADNAQSREEKRQRKYALNNVKNIKSVKNVNELFDERYNQAVKQLIADYILKANITTRDEIVEYIDSLFKITDRLKDKLFNRIGER